MLYPELAHDKGAVAQFRNEIFASYAVSHPHVVRAYEYLHEGDLVAYTSEYVDGGNLSAWIAQPAARRPLPEVIRLLDQMSAGLQAIHDADIIHRDLKPENILLTNDENVKISDFGIAEETSLSPKLTEHQEAWLVPPTT